VTRKLPLLPTLIVAAAVATMIALGVWQLQRKHWKESLIARYQAAEAVSVDVPWPRSPAETERALYRHARLFCDRVTGVSAIAGRSAGDVAGWAHVAKCQLSGGGEADIALGWSREPADVAWSGGEVSGFVAPAGKGGARLVAAPPKAGLAQLAAPDPLDLPNNHLSYAVQWFFFAATAAVIYVLALRKRWREADGAKRS
jgi:surfeit locus 1 family protein